MKLAGPLCTIVYLWAHYLISQSFGLYCKVSIIKYILYRVAVKINWDIEHKGT